MKKNFISTAMTVVMATIFSLGFAACGGDDGGSSDSSFDGSGSDPSGSSIGTFKGAKRVFGNNLVKAFSKEGEYRWEFTYDADGFMTQAKETQSYYTYVWDISYDSNKITCTRNSYETRASKSSQKIWTINIGSNGFVSKATYSDETDEFSYDANGHLTRFSIMEDGEYDDDVNLTWQNGNVVSAVNNDKTPKNYTVTYQKDSQGPFTNDAGLVDLDHMTAIDVDVIDLLVYAGAIGFGPTHLPISSTCQSAKREEQCTNTWQFDSQHRATRIEQKKDYIEEGYSYSETKVYTWEY